MSQTDSVREQPAGTSDTYALSSYRVCDIPLSEQPRELFDRWGVDHLPDTVLLSIILRSGVPGMSVVELSRHLLQKYGSLTDMARAPVEDLSAVRGIGRVKAQVLKSALELGRRISAEQAPLRRVVRKPEDAAGVLRETARSLEREIFWVLLLDAKYGLKKPPVEVSRGLLDASLVHPREVFREAICSASAAMIMVHNHPSGDPTPSAEDLRITRQLIEAGRIIDIPVLDHVILGRVREGSTNDYCSLRETGMVQFS